MKYDMYKLRQALQDEYMAAMVVGFSEDTPSLTDLQFAPDDWILTEAERRGFDMEEFLLKEEDGGSDEPGSENPAPGETAQAGTGTADESGFHMDRFFYLEETEDDDMPAGGLW